MENANNKKNFYAILAAVALLAIVAGAAYYLRPAEVKAPSDVPAADTPPARVSPTTSSVPPERRRFEDEASILREFGIKYMNKDPDTMLYNDATMRRNTEDGERELKGFGLNYWRETGTTPLDEVYAALVNALGNKGFGPDELNPDISLKATTTANFRRDDLLCSVSRIRAEKTENDHVGIKCASFRQTLGQ